MRALLLCLVGNFFFSPILQLCNESEGHFHIIHSDCCLLIWIPSDGIANICLALFSCIEYGISLNRLLFCSMAFGQNKPFCKRSSEIWHLLIFASRHTFNGFSFHFVCYTKEENETNLPNMFFFCRNKAQCHRDFSNETNTFSWSGHFDKKKCEGNEFQPLMTENGWEFRWNEFEASTLVLTLRAHYYQWMHF